jgi:N-ethylmaleimide reductase
VLTTSIAEAVAAQQASTQQAPVELLFRPYKLGTLDLPHRVVMAPLTRSRARQPGNVPTLLNACYYAQRASAALIVSEATQVSMQGQGYAWTPGIHSREQIEGWRLVTDAVHEAGGPIFLQLSHVGRISHPSLQPDNMLPVAPSTNTPAGNAFIENEKGEGNWCRSCGRGLCRSRRCPTSSSNMPASPGTRWPPISTAWRCMLGSARNFASVSLF